MKKLLLFSLLIVLASHDLLAQSKKELRAEIDELKAEVTQKDAALAEAKKIENISVANAKEYQAQVEELKAANTTLLANLKTLTEATTQRSDNISRTLETIQRKEAQLKIINEEIVRFDSIALLTLSDFKRTLGEDALIGAQPDAIIVELSEVGLFGSATASDIVAEGSDFLNKIASVIKQHQNVDISLVVSVMEGPIDESTKKRAEAIMSSFHSALDPEINKVSLKYGNSSARSFQLRIHPDWTAFYLKTRDAVKNSG